MSNLYDKVIMSRCLEFIRMSQCQFEKIMKIVFMHFEQQPTVQLYTISKDEF